MSYILIRNLPNKLPDIHLETIKTALDKIAHFGYRSFDVGV